VHPFTDFIANCFLLLMDDVCPTRKSSPSGRCTTLCPTLTFFALNDCCCRSISLERSKLPCEIAIIFPKLDSVPNSVATFQNHIRSTDTRPQLFFNWKIQGLQVVARLFRGTYLVEFWSSICTSLLCVLWESERGNREGWIWKSSPALPKYIRT
jgi:hypothetical protein